MKCNSHRKGHDGSLPSGGITSVDFVCSEVVDRVESASVRESLKPLIYTINMEREITIRSFCAHQLGYVATRVLTKVHLTQKTGVI